MPSSAADASPSFRQRAPAAKCRTGRSGKPKLITATLARIQARKVRSLARYSVPLFSSWTWADWESSAVIWIPCSTRRGYPASFPRAISRLRPPTRRPRASRWCAIAAGSRIARLLPARRPSRVALVRDRCGLPHHEAPPCTSPFARRAGARSLRAPASRGSSLGSLGRLLAMREFGSDQARGRDFQPRRSLRDRRLRELKTRAPLVPRSSDIWFAARGVSQRGGCLAPRERERARDQARGRARIRASRGPAAQPGPEQAGATVRSRASGSDG